MNRPLPPPLHETPLRPGSWPSPRPSNSPRHFPREAATLAENRLPANTADQFTTKDTKDTKTTKDRTNVRRRQSSTAKSSLVTPHLSLLQSELWLRHTKEVVIAERWRLRRRARRWTWVIVIAAPVGSTRECR